MVGGDAGQAHGLAAGHAQLAARRRQPRRRRRRHGCTHTRLASRRRVRGTRARGTWLTGDGEQRGARALRAAGERVAREAAVRARIARAHLADQQRVARDHVPGVCRETVRQAVLLDQSNT